ncbi:hypothetical protein ACET9Z_15945 [Aeromonas veronii]|uniref:hypothetical protein n=1 Tax=Aeromonas TaxID=642 RepID=UPI00191E09F9|nr:hypothetical protein [Aeromonas jandaei]MBL0597597.1 hypothetical protein [Aeromonas jandaei]
MMQFISSKKLKLSKLFLILTLAATSIFTFFPFINGLGCNFETKTMTQAFDAHGKCYMGILTIIQKEHLTSSLNKKVMLWGYSGNTVSIIQLDSKILADTRHPKLDVDAYLDDIYRDIVFRFYAVFKGEENSYVFLSNSPTPLIFKTEMKGKLGFYEDMTH